MKGEKNKQGQPTYLKIQNKGHKKDVITTAYNKQLTFSRYVQANQGWKGKGGRRDVQGEVKNKGGLSSHPDSDLDLSFFTPSCRERLQS